MSYHIHAEKRPNTVQLDPTVWVLEDGQGSGIEVWPALGFNCYRWFIAPGHELLYAVPEFFEQKKPTRSGFPILFPFPNRIRAGRFAWHGQPYQLACNDPAGKNAIHGFACHSPWNVVDQGVCNDGAWITGEFHAADHGAEAMNWSADYRVRLTYRLGKSRLRLEARIDNPAGGPLPFGLGYHPYFQADFLGDPETTVQIPAAAYWELEENLPTGKISPVTGHRDLRAGQKIAGLELDDVLTDLDTPKGQELVLRGALRSAARESALEMWTSSDFREMVVFTPPHRRAICLEPYTCTTDAVNLQERHIPAGWRVLGTGETWVGVVEMRVV